MDDVATAPVDATLDAPSVDDGGSLSDHEAAFGPAAQRTPPVAASDDDTSADRDERGQFKPRHRAESQKAGTDDIAAINEHTRRIKEAESKLGADITQQPGESNRVYQLRRRAELLERQASAPAKSEPRPAPAAREPEPPPVARQPEPPRAATFPTFEDYIAIKGNEDKSWYEYQSEFTRHEYARLRAEERAQEASEAAERAFQEHVTTYTGKMAAVLKAHPDFDEVVDAANASHKSSKVIERAVIEAGPETAYYLATHLDELDALTADTLVHPDNPAFRSTVAATRRYLASLVAAEQRPSPSSRTAAGSTGAALAFVAPSTPKPPTPVRTGSIRDSEMPPGDEASLADHEKAYYKPGRRA